MQELPSGGVSAVRRRQRDPEGLEDPADGGRTNSVAELEQLAPDRSDPQPLFSVAGTSQLQERPDGVAGSLDESTCVGSRSWLPWLPGGKGTTPLDRVLASANRDARSPGTVPGCRD